MTQEWFPDQITFETPERFPQVMQTLKQMGHTIVRTGPLPQGDAHTIWVERPGTYVGVADSRLNGQASGY
jgi:gamma-glutamyltranspeptidase